MSASRPTLLIVDDERNTCAGLERLLRGRYEVSTAFNGRSALALAAAKPFDLVLTDVKMPGMDGITLVGELKALDPGTVICVMSAYGDIATAVEALKKGAYDFFQKPLDLAGLERGLADALASRRPSPPVLAPPAASLVTAVQALPREALGPTVAGLAGDSAVMRDLIKLLRQAAPARATVLITGESGTGKELAARALHDLGPRRDKPFVAVHCASLSSTLLESELFGHEKGAFTGAAARRQGRFEAADGGTLFLDEIGEIDAATQVKLLRVLEQRSFERVGGNETVRVDVRLVCATHRDLAALVAAGQFREDLYFRINVICVRMPPLREHPEDIPAIATQLLRQIAADNGLAQAQLTPDGLAALQSRCWSGNVRELRNTLERLLVLSPDGRISAAMLPPEVATPASGPAAAAPAAMGSGLDVGAHERQLILTALQRTGGNRTQAAAMLGLSRRTLHRRLNELGLENYPDA